MRVHPPSPPRTSKALILSFLLAALGLFLVHRHVFAVYIVDGSSMAPALNSGDAALVNMLTPRFGRLQRGEIVLVRDGFAEYATKRIVGLPGEKIEIKDCHVYINGQPLREDYLPPDTVTASSCSAFALGEGEYFVLGDNRPESYDSRVYGPVPKEAIVGSYTRFFWAWR